MFYKKKRKDYDLIFFDSETKKDPNSNNQILTMCSFCNVKFIGINQKNNSLIYDFENPEYLTFNTITESHNFLQNKFCAIKEKNYYLIAHNTDFDFKVMKLFEFFSKNNFEIKHFIYNLNFIFTFYNKDLKVEVTIFDSFGIIRNSLKQIGNDIGIKKIEFDFNKKYTESELIQYNLNDVKIIVKLFEFLISELKIIKFTIGSYALYLFFTYFCNQKFTVDKKEDIKLLNNVCRGGDNEIFKIGKFTNQEKKFIVDVNSLYPYIMKSCKMPVKFIKSIRGQDIPIQTLKELLEDNHLTILARLHITNNNPYGIFAKKYNNFLIFPIGSFNICLCDQELKFIFEQDSGITINKIYQIEVYQNKFIFDKYIDYMYSQKTKFSPSNNNNPSCYMLYKYLMNSLSGKFAQKEKTLINLGYYDLSDGNYSISDQGNYYKITVINHNAYTLITEKHFSKNSYPSIYACITGNSRMYLRKIMIQIGFNNIYYCDTDSLILNEIGLKKLESLNMLDPDILGKFKLENEKKPLKDLKIYGLKSYSYTGSQKINNNKILKNEFEIKPEIKSEIIKCLNDQNIEVDPNISIQDLSLFIKDHIQKNPDSKIYCNKNVFKIKGIKNPIDNLLNDHILSDQFKINNNPDIRTEILNFLKKQKISVKKNITDQDLEILLKEYLVNNPDMKIFKQLKFLRLGSSLIQKDINNQKILDILKFNQIYNYNKGIIIEHGLIKPFTLNEKILFDSDSVPENKDLDPVFTLNPFRLEIYGSDFDSVPESDSEFDLKNIFSVPVFDFDSDSNFTDFVFKESDPVPDPVPVPLIKIYNEFSKRIEIKKILK